LYGHLVVERDENRWLKLVVDELEECRILDFRLAELVGRCGIAVTARFKLLGDPPRKRGVDDRPSDQAASASLTSRSYSTASRISASLSP